MHVLTTEALLGTLELSESGIRANGEGKGSTCDASDAPSVLKTAWAIGVPTASATFFSPSAATSRLPVATCAKAQLVHVCIGAHNINLLAPSSTIGECAH